jgi:hypothetical protein
VLLQTKKYDVKQLLFERKDVSPNQCSVGMIESKFKITELCQLRASAL